MWKSSKRGVLGVSSAIYVFLGGLNSKVLPQENTHTHTHTHLHTGTHTHTHIPIVCSPKRIYSADYTARVRSVAIRCSKISFNMTYENFHKFKIQGVPTRESVLQTTRPVSVVLCSFNQFYKLNPDIWRLWMQVVTAATCCDTLQHTATRTVPHSNTLQRALTCGACRCRWCCVVQCVAVCCSVLQCVTVRCSVLQCVVVCRSVLQCVVVCCRCVAVCCSVSQCVAVRCSVLQCVAVRCSVLQCVVVCCSVR